MVAERWVFLTAFFKILKNHKEKELELKSSSNSSSFFFAQ